MNRPNPGFMQRLIRTYYMKWVRRKNNKTNSPPHLFTESEYRIVNQLKKKHEAKQGKVIISPQLSSFINFQILKLIINYFL